LGIISLFLISPIQRKEENRWLSTFSKSFYFALIPIIVVLFISIGKRVFDYGITEERYFIIVIALWLAGISTYFIVSKNKNKIFIPLSIAIISLLSVFGPWDSFNISKISQYGRVEKKLKELKLIVNNKLVKITEPLKDDVYYDLYSLLSYFEKTHGIKTLKFIDKEDATNLSANQIALKYLKNEEISDEKTTYLTIYAKDNYFSVKGYDLLLPFLQYKEYSFENYHIYKEKHNIIIELNNKVVDSIDLEKLIDINKIESNITEGKDRDNISSIPIEHLTYNYENKFLKLCIVVKSIYGYRYSSGKWQDINLEFYMLLNKK